MIGNYNNCDNQGCTGPVLYSKFVSNLASSMRRFLSSLSTLQSLPFCTWITAPAPRGEPGPLGPRCCPSLPCASSPRQHLPQEYAPLLPCSPQSTVNTSLAFKPPVIWSLHIPTQLFAILCTHGFRPAKAHFHHPVNMPRPPSVLLRLGRPAWPALKALPGHTPP